MDKNYTTLILNTDMTPLKIVSWQRALVLQFLNEEGLKEGIEIMDFYRRPNAYVMSASGKKYPIPSIARCTSYVKRFRNKVPLAKRYVFLRDKFTCQYCGKVAESLSEKHSLTLDHVIPRAIWRDKKYQGSATNWENVVTSCLQCNRKKADKQLEKCDLTLKRRPFEPSPENMYGALLMNHMEPEWEPYVGHLLKRK